MTAEALAIPVYSQILDRADHYRLAGNSVYLFAQSEEDRSAAVETLMPSHSDVRFRIVQNQAWDSFSVDGASFSTRSKRSMDEFVRIEVNSVRVYLDITGFVHSVWAPILRSLLTAGKDVTVVYVEPAKYQESRAPTEGDIYDLTERIEGIKPIPGFFGWTNDARSVLIATLGFEGTRLGHILENIAISDRNVFPIIGVPGFRPEYPFYSFLGNKIHIQNRNLSHNIHYAQANCPFECYRTIGEIADKNPDMDLVLAPIGTKPHALGSFLYSVANSGSRKIDIVYDHPIRKGSRTTGADRLVAFPVSRFIREVVEA